MKRILSGIAAAAVMVSIFTACSKNKNSSKPETVTTSPVTSEPEDPHKMDITWLADYDLNPEEGEMRSAALTLYEKVYGGKVNYVYTSAKDRFTNLDNMLASGEEVDMLPFEMSDFPNGTIKNRYQPLDPYFNALDMDSELWNGMRSAVDTFEYKGQHYVVPYSVSDPLFLTYSRKITDGEKLGDPYKLYKEGKWDWKAFTDIMNKFVESAPQGAKRYGIQGVFGEAALYSTGHTVINYENGKLVNNIANPEIEKAAKLLRDLSDKQFYLNPKNFPAGFPEDHSTLFYAMSDWALGASNGENKDMDLMVVPFPKAEGSDKYYFCGNYNAKMLAFGSKKGEAVAAYIKCERLAAANEKYAEEEKKSALKVKNNVDGEPLSFITEEQYDAIAQFKDLEKFSPIFDFGYGMGEKMYGFGEYTYETRGVMNNITAAMLDETDKADSWQSFRASVGSVIDQEIAAYNK